MTTADSGLRAAVLGIVVNLSLSIIKIVTGLIGNSYALIADGLESTADIGSSLVVWGGLRMAAVPPDEQHPYGHGKAESLAGAVAACGLLAAALAIAVQCIREIRTPHHAPEWFTLPVLLVVIVIKELLARYALKTGRSLDSNALRIDAWHHRSDALTSAAVAVGILVALVGGRGYESADDWAALIACVAIAGNGVMLLRSSVHDVMDAAVAPEIRDAIRSTAAAVEGVTAIEKIRVRKSGLGLLMDIHVEVDGAMTVTESHAIAHRVKDRLLESDPRIHDVVVHIEPAP